MNIFATSAIPSECAIMLDDKRLNKMITESNQLLSNALYSNGGNNLYKPTHINHPCSVWVRTSRDNFLWLVELTQHMVDEFKFRYEHDHAGQQILNHTKTYSHLLPDAGLTAFANCSLFKQALDVHVAYQATMAFKWGVLDAAPKWTKRQRPDWYNNYIDFITQQVRNGNNKQDI